MKIVNGPKVLECSMKELFKEYWAGNEEKAEAESGIVGLAFADEIRDNPRFKILGPCHEIHFNSRELLCRFATMPKVAQENLIRAIDRIFVEIEVDEIRIEIGWSVSKTRILRISSNARPLSVQFDLLPVIAPPQEP